MTDFYIISGTPYDVLDDAKEQGIDLKEQNIGLIKKPFKIKQIRDIISKYPKGSTMMIVDDEKEIRNLLQTVVRKDGYSTIICEDGNKALAEYRKHNREISLVLTDFIIPEMNGLQLIGKIKELEMELYK